MKLFSRDITRVIEMTDQASFAIAPYCEEDQLCDHVEELIRTYRKKIPVHGSSTIQIKDEYFRMDWSYERHIKVLVFTVLTFEEITLDQYLDTWSAVNKK